MTLRRAESEAMEESESEPVRVFIRLRPEPLFESNGSRRNVERCVRAIDEKTIRFSPPDAIYGSRKGVPAVDDKIYTFDAVFDEQASQEQIYEMVRTNVKATVKGFNTTIFAYGSTGSGASHVVCCLDSFVVGKSHTMTGTTAQPGIIPRAISEVFAFIEAAASQENDVFFYVRLSYVELYNNNFRNLLEFAAKELSSKERADDAGDNFGVGLRSKIRIEVRESHAAGVFLAGPHLRIPVTTAQEAFSLISRGNKSRAVGATQCNDVSSRSHAILTVHVESRVNPKGGSTELRLGKMHLVDLAGSERVSMSGAEGDTLTETQNINLSLSAIGDVLSALSRNATVMSQLSGGKSSPMGQTWPSANSLVPVPYRNSKLTHLLKDSLGGNSKTIMITTLRTSNEYAQLTSASLMYSSRAKKIRNRSLVNHNIIGDTGIAKVSSEIERLRNRLDERTREFERLRQLHLEENKENLALKTRLQELQLANEFEKRELETQMSQVIHSQAGELALQKERIVSLQSALEQELSVSLNRIAEQEREIKWLQKALDESSETPENISRLKHELTEWMTQAQQAQSSLALELRRTEQLQSTNSALSQKIVEYEEVMQELAQEKEDLSASLSQVQDELNYANYGKRAVEMKCNALEEKLKSTVEEGILRDTQLRDFRSSLESAKSLQTKQELQNKELLDANVALKAREAALQNENMRLKNMLEQSVAALEKETVSALDSASKRASSAESTRLRLESQLAIAAAEISGLKEELEKKSTENSHLTRENEGLNNNIRFLTETDRDSQREIGSLRRNDREQRSVIDKLNKELTSKNAEIEDISIKYAEDLELRVLEVQTMKKHHADELLRERERYRLDTDAWKSSSTELGDVQSENETLLLSRESKNKMLSDEVTRLEKELLLHKNVPTVDSGTSPDLDSEEYGSLIMEDRVINLKRDYDAKINALQSEHKTFLEEALSTQRVKYKLLMKEKLSEVRNKYEMELAQKLQEASESATTAAAEMQHQHDAIICSKNAEIQKMEALLSSDGTAVNEFKNLNECSENKAQLKLPVTNEIAEVFPNSHLESKVELESIQATFATLKHQLDVLVDQIKGSNGSVNCLDVLDGEEYLSCVKQLEEAYNEKIESLWAMIGGREEALKEMESGLTRESEKNNSLEAELKMVEKVLNDYSAHIESFSENPEVAGIQIGLQQRVMRVLEESTALKEAEISELKSSFERDLERALSERMYLENALKTAEAEWGVKLGSSQVAFATLQHQLDVLVDQIKGSNGSVNCLGGEEYLGCVKQLEEAYNEKIESLWAMIGDREEALKEIESSFREVSDRSASLESENYSLTMRTEEFTYKIKEISEAGAVIKQRLEEELIKQRNFYEQRFEELREEQTTSQMRSESFSTGIIHKLEEELTDLRCQIELNSSEAILMKEQFEEKSNHEKLAMEAAHLCVVRELEKKIASTEERHSAAMAELEEQILNERRLKFVAIKAEAEHAVAEAEQLLRDEHNSKLSQLISQHSFEIGSMQVELDETRTALSKSVEEYKALALLLEDTEASFEEQVVERLHPIQLAYDELRTTYQSLNDVNKELSESYANLTMKHKDLQLLHQQLKVNCDLELDRQQQLLVKNEASVSAHEEAYKSMSAQMKMLEEELESARIARASSAKEHVLNTQLLQDEFDQRYQQLLKDNEAEVRALVDEKVKCFARIDELEGKLELAILDAVRKNESDIASLKESHSSDMLTAQSQHREALLKLQLECDSREEGLLSTHRRTLTEVRAAYEADIAAAEEWNENVLRRRITESTFPLQERILSLQENLEQQEAVISALTEQLALSKKDYESKLLELSQEHSSASKDSQSRVFSISEANAKLVENIAKMREDHKYVIEQLHIQHEKDLSDREAVWVNGMDDRIARLSAENATSIENLKNEYSISEKRLRHQLEGIILERDRAITEMRAEMGNYEVIIKNERDEMERLERFWNDERLRFHSERASQFSAIREELLTRASLLGIQQEKFEHAMTSRCEQEVRRLVGLLVLIPDILRAINEQNDEHQRKMSLSVREVYEISAERDELLKIKQSLEKNCSAFRESEAKWSTEVSDLMSKIERLKSNRIAELSALRDLLIMAQGFESALKNELEETNSQISLLHTHIQSIVSANSVRLSEANEKVMNLERMVKEQSERWDDERERLLETSQQTLQDAIERGQAQLLENEREHIIRLDLVHEQLREVEARHSVRVQRLEESLTLVNDEKQQLMEALQAKDALMEDLKDQMEEMQIRYEGSFSNNFKRAMEAEKRRIDASYRNEITQLVDRLSHAQQKLDGSFRSCKSLEERLAVTQKDLLSVSIEKKVLEDIYSKLMEGRHVDSLNDIRRTISMILKEYSAPTNQYPASLNGNLILRNSSCNQ